MQVTHHPYLKVFSKFLSKSLKVDSPKKIHNKDNSKLGIQMRSIKNRKKRGQVKAIKYRSNREKETQKGKGISVRKNQKKKKKNLPGLFL